MRLIKCDECGIEKVDLLPMITLICVPGKCGIMLPDCCHEKHFCKPECFWKWVRKNDPLDDEKRMNDEVVKEALWDKLQVQVTQFNQST